jgi:hypothetical protein
MIQLREILDRAIMSPDVAVTGYGLICYPDIFPLPEDFMQESRRRPVVARELTAGLQIFAVNGVRKLRCEFG